MHFRQKRKSMQDISISDPIDIDKDGNSITLMDIVQDDENILDSIDLSIQSQKLYHFIEQNLDQDLSLDRVAQHYNYSPAYISRIFKEITGSSLVRYIIEKRIGCAKQMLYDDMEIMRVAEKVGYRNYSNFYKAFRKAVGCGPEEFRKKAQEQ